MLEEERRVIVMEGEWSPLQAARDIIAGGAADEPFYVSDLRELAARHARWRALMPRVEPFYDMRVLLGVDTMTVDSECELIKIKQHMPHAQVVLRIRCDSAQAQLSFGARFGCDPETEAPALLKLAAALGLDVAGVSFHVGTNTEEYEAYARAIRHCRDVFALGAAAGLARMRLVDVGGGFPGRGGADMEEVSAIINAALETHFPEPGVRVIAEPGRYFAAAAYTLAVQVYGKREIRREDGDVHTMYTIGDGVYGSFNCVVSVGERVEPLLLHPSDEKPRPCSLWGPSCCPLDCVLAAAALPPLPPGCWLLFRDMGAYTLSVSSHFNGFRPARVETFADRKLWSLLKNQWPFLECDFSAVGALSGEQAMWAGPARDKGATEMNNCNCIANGIHCDEKTVT